MNGDLKSIIEKFKESKMILDDFSNKEDAIDFLIKETGLSKEECDKAYNILINIDLNKNI